MGRHLAILLLACAAGAVEPSFAEALAAAPSLAAASARIAVEERAAATAGVLPDPLLSVDAGRMRSMGESAWMYGASLEQPLPRWGERDARRLEATARIGAARAAWRSEVGEQAAAVAAALAEAAAAHATAAVQRGILARLDTLRTIIDARAASGAATSLDALAIASRRDAVELAAADAERRAADAEAEARGRLGLPPDGVLPALAVPDPAALDADRQPLTDRARAERDDALAAGALAASRGRPETAIGARWEREDARLDSQQDTVSLMLTVSLPVWRGAYDAAVESARARERAAAHELHAAGWMARSRIARAQRAEEQAARATTAADTAAARAATATDSIRQQIASGTASLPAALDLLDRIDDARQQAIEARLLADTARADLWRIAPPELPEK